jgi:hypothetical protein
MIKLRHNNIKNCTIIVDRPRQNIICNEVLLLYGFPIESGLLEVLTGICIGHLLLHLDLS